MGQVFEILRTATITLPVLEVIALIVLMGFCLVCRFAKGGLIVAYLFVYRWGWLFIMSKQEDFLLAYLIFGLVVAVLTVIGMWHSPPSDG